MSEKHYVFIKNGRVEDTYVFADQDDALADRIVVEKGFDKALWIGEDLPPHRWSSYDEKTNTFTDPTEDYLISIGVLNVEVPTEPVK